ncbi:hypothetical protein Q4575_09100 [Psychrosphaera sp. 1_MG-2023]|uniref:hypothetical protein n=1 Tax=Psychrosphaera sp. 1_MG-2023 TaxID=3062643 RepID=UPI0026E3A6F3|nr:hypothetical protein [Psychrosphaera sp. 1_MG-2023]MDO6719556.1 hypothetical protein [Psychrosphaera sp. 1_MG-2023]
MEINPSENVVPQNHVVVELQSNYIAQIRLSIYKIISLLLETENNELAYLLKNNLFYHLSSPSMSWKDLFLGTPFENSKLEIENVYGKDINNEVLHIKENLKLTIEYGNPLFLALENYLFKVSDVQETKIYCKTRHHADFMSLSQGIPDINATCIMNVTEYKRTKNFENLVVVGPIRMDSMSSVPSYLLRNIKWKNLVQFIWQGGQNDFSAFNNPLTNIRTILQPHLDNEIKVGLTIQKEVFTSHHFQNREQEEEPDSAIFDEFEKLKILSIDKLPAIALILNNREAIFIKPNSKIFILDRLSNDNSSLRHDLAVSYINDDLSKSYFLNIDYAALETESHRNFKANYEDIWKDVLGEQDLDELLGKLLSDGIKIKNLKDRVFSWIEYSQDIIHAPGDKENFVILLKAIKGDIIQRYNIESENFNIWIEEAWNEILMSRGEAITEGKSKHDQYHQLINDMLPESLDEIRGLLTSTSILTYELKLSSLNIPITFLPIKKIMLGYEAPNSLINTILPINEIEIYK